MNIPAKGLVFDSGRAAKDSKCGSRRFLISLGTSHLGGWDLLFRQQEISTELAWEVNLLNPQDASLRSSQIIVEDAEDLVVNGQELSCFRLNVEGKIFWVSSVGRLIRYHDPERNLTVELDL